MLLKVHLGGVWMRGQRGLQDGAYIGRAGSGDLGGGTRDEAAVVSTISEVGLGVSPR